MDIECNLFMEYKVLFCSV